MCLHDLNGSRTYGEYLLHRFPTHLTDREEFVIEHIRLVVEVNGTDTDLIMPSTVKSSTLLPLHVKEFKFNEMEIDGVE